MNRTAPKLEILLDHGRAAFEPSARVSGVAAWTAPAPPAGIELRLSWVMVGKGGRDLKIVETVPLPEPRAAERRPFILTLPEAPYSFRGALVKLVWTLELVALPGEEKAAVVLTVAPGAQLIDLRPSEPG